MFKKTKVKVTKGLDTTVVLIAGVLFKTDQIIKDGIKSVANGN